MFGKKRNLMSSYTVLTVLLMISISSSFSSFEISANSSISDPCTTHNIVNETILEIIQVEVKPQIAIIHQPVFLNITVKNNGQFEMAKIENVKAETNISTGQKDIYLGGNLNDLKPGELGIVQINLTFIESGCSFVKITFSADNIQDTSTTVHIQIIEESTTIATNEFLIMFFWLAFIPILSRKSKKT